MGHNKDGDNSRSEQQEPQRHTISLPIAQQINIMFESGTYPTELKRAKIIPVLKSGENTNINNYRPISILPIISKVVEGTIRDRLVKFFEDRRLFCDAQHGYRRGRSTITAMVELMDAVADAWDKGERIELSSLRIGDSFAMHSMGIDGEDQQ
ncbi:Reverse transcriptase (RNA-dependent DNA polymerase) [Popillia japonica]|uniref:Reverse transcriptase (RNA-dependent DNA polymerase) n=1 Tax=Popillia japonica TaxID=7064 RepID=A0AAW1JFZ3_POPJA